MRDPFSCEFVAARDSGTKFEVAKRKGQFTDTMAAGAAVAVSAVHALVTEFDDDPLYGNHGRGHRFPLPSAVRSLIHDSNPSPSMDNGTYPSMNNKCAAQVNNKPGANAIH